MSVAGLLPRTNPLHPPCFAAPKLDLCCRKELRCHASSSCSADGYEKMTVQEGKDGWKIDFSGGKPETPLLDKINYPVHMKNLSTKDLEQLAAELRADIVHTVSETGGHLSSSLGVVELSVALHHVFSTPEDKIIWDVGHQAYPHKILTGRRSKMHTMRKTSGLAGFPKRDESVHDAFGAGHSSTSISAGLGVFLPPVRFALDRAGLVGADGPTHCGAFDITYMASLPNMVVMAPSDEAELIHMVATAAAIDDRPSCFRFPRGNGVGKVLPPNNKGKPLEIGKGRILMEGNKVAILGFGSIVQQCIEAGNTLSSRNVSVTVADARFCKPLDGELIRRLAKEHENLITVEEGAIGGFGSHVAHFLSLNGLLDGDLKLRSMVLPDRYIDHGSPQDQIEEAGLTSTHIAATVLSLLGRREEILTL